MLTNTQLQKAKAKDITYRLYDTGGLAGLYVEITPTLHMTFQLKYRINGIEKRLNCKN